MRVLGLDCLKLREKFLELVSNIKADIITTSGKQNDLIKFLMREALTQTTLTKRNQDLLVFILQN